VLGGCEGCHLVFSERGCVVSPDCGMFLRFIEEEDA